MEKCFGGKYRLDYLYLVPTSCYCWKALCMLYQSCFINFFILLLKKLSYEGRTEATSIFHEPIFCQDLHLDPKLIQGDVCAIFFNLIVKLDNVEWCRCKI